MTTFLVNSAAAQRQTQMVQSMMSSSSIQLEDWTEVSRIGFRGPAVTDFLLSEQLPVPEQPNQVLLAQSGIRVLRLSKTEFWLIDESQQNGQALADMEGRALKLENVYRLYCQHSHAAIVASGTECGSMFAKVCGVDLTHTAFAAGQIAQTSMARVNAIIINLSSHAQTSDRYLILSDVSSSQHLWDSLMDAAEEF